MSDSSDNLRNKPCRCGGTMGQIIGFSDPDEHRPDPYPIRKGWYCIECRDFEEAILRERTVTPDQFP